MELKETLLSSYMAFDAQDGPQRKLQDQRAAAIEVFEQQGFPSNKEEDWKYTSLRALTKVDYSVFPKEEVSLKLEEVKQYILQDVDTYKIVFVDGIYNAYLSETTHEGADICLLSAALTKRKYAPIIKKYFNQIAEKEASLTALNTAFTNEGAFIYVPEGKQVEKPVQIIHFATTKNPKLLLQPRNLIVLEKNAELQVVERHQSLSDNTTFTNVVTEIFTEQNAQLDYYKIQNDQSQASLIDSTYIAQQKHSHAKVHTFSLGGKLIRNNLNFYHKAPEIISTMKGITLIEGEQFVDHHTLVHHAHPNSESHQDYKGIYAEKATGVFNGKIVVEKEAQKTNAFQKNNNILMDDKASINTKPQLEIFADDVKCSHGCTIGQLDEDALFYLQTRGIPKKEARGLLTYAFANNVLQSVQIDSVKKRINKLIAEKLGVNIGFDV
ncbi:MAG: Fe-S cluster assembly protein SufD [Flavobacteriaceae bacterium]|nr:Fe-S cluster assembly protein SufD [Flavobacteriaceae bacterium]